MPLYRRLLLCALAVAACHPSSATYSATVHVNFGFSPNLIGTNVTAETVFTATRGCGFESGAAVTTTSVGVESTRPFYFSATVPAEGNYRVTVTFPPLTDATIKAELRRLMVENVRVPFDAPATTRTFLVNTRTPKISALGASYELSKAIVRATRDQKLPLAKFIGDECTSFSPAQPDDPMSFAVPASPNFSNQRPLGDEAK